MGAQINHPCPVPKDPYCCDYLPYLKSTSIIKQPYPLEDIELGYADLAVNFIEKHKGDPFFLYVGCVQQLLPPPPQMLLPDSIY